jgi:hypothetical protein
VSKADKLINAIKLRDMEQIKTILEEDGELVNAFDETGATALTTRHLMGFAKSSNCYSTEAQKSTAETASLAPRQQGGQSSICERGAAILALSSKTLLMPLSLEMRGGWHDFWNAFLRFARAVNGKPFRQLAEESGNREIAALFRLTGKAGS